MRGLRKAFWVSAFAAFLAAGAVAERPRIERLYTQITTGPSFLFGRTPTITGSFHYISRPTLTKHPKFFIRWSTEFDFLGSWTEAWPVDISFSGSRCSFTIPLGIGRSSFVELKSGSALGQLLVTVDGTTTVAGVELRETAILADEFPTKLARDPGNLPGGTTIPITWDPSVLVASSEAEARLPAMAVIRDVLEAGQSWSHGEFDPYDAQFNKLSVYSRPPVGRRGWYGAPGPDWTLQHPDRPWGGGSPFILFDTPADAGASCALLRHEYLVALHSSGGSLLRSTSVLGQRVVTSTQGDFYVHRETSGVVRSYPDDELGARLSAITLTCPDDGADLGHPTAARTDLVDLYAVHRDASLDELYRGLPTSDVRLALRFSSIEDLKLQLEATLKPNQAIRQLEVLGHGSPYHIGPIDTCSVAAFAEVVSRYLSPGGTVYLSGCNTGVASDPPNIAQALADTGLSSTVYGARGFLYNGTLLAGTIMSSESSPVGSTAESVPMLKLAGAENGGPAVGAFNKFVADPKGGPCYVCLDTTDDGKSLDQLGFPISWRRALTTHVLSRGWGSAPVAPPDDANVLRLRPDLVFSASGDVYELYCIDGPGSVLRRKSDRREVQFNAPAAQQAGLSGILRPFAFETQP